VVNFSSIWRKRLYAIWRKPAPVAVRRLVRGELSNRCIPVRRVETYVTITV
jgi:hypothetical protein